MPESDSISAAEADEPVRAVDGRVPKRRGLATRSRLLEATLLELGKNPYRHLTVADIAKRAQTSPSTFYQYFPSIDLAVLELAGNVVLDRERLSVIIKENDWQGANAHAAAKDLVKEFLAFWAQHRPVLEAVDILLTEGDGRFHETRISILSALTSDIAEAADHSAPYSDAASDPKAVGAVLVSMLAHVAAHQPGLTSRGFSTDSLEAVMTRIIATVLSR